MTEKLSLAPLATTLSYSKTWIKKVYMKAEMVLFCLRFLASKQMTAVKYSFISSFRLAAVLGSDKALTNNFTF